MSDSDDTQEINVNPLIELSGHRESRREAILGQFYDHATRGGVPPLDLFLELLQFPHDDILEYVPMDYLIAWFDGTYAKSSIYRIVAKSPTPRLKLGGKVFYHYKLPFGLLYQKGK